jgi:UDP-glucose 4-epimerase
MKLSLLVSILLLKAAWYGDPDYLYTYSNITKQALGWTKELSDLKQIVEELVGANSIPVY